MLLIGVIKGTPAWVWILFVFLMLRGIKALSDREMEVKRLFLLPLVFLFWGGYSVINELHFPLWGLASMLVGLIVGFGIGWIIWRSGPRLKQKVGTNLIVRAGTPLTLIFIIIAFGVKYILVAMLSIHSKLAISFDYNLIFGFLSGVIDGIFWGGTLNLYFTPRQTDDHSSACSAR
jgi:hypothetical protein